MINFGTKSEILKCLENRLKSGTVLPQVAFTVEEWDAKAVHILEQIEKTFAEQAVIVRSSAINEDTLMESHAGQYESVLNVVGKEQLQKSINAVKSSFQDQNPQNQIFVQPMLSQVEMSGVVFTRNPSSGGYYYVINYDDTTGTTDTITSGTKRNSKLFYCFRTVMPEDERLAGVILMAQELERILEHQNLDIEFAISSDHVLYLLQVRPLIMKETTVSLAQEKKLLDQISYRIKKGQEDVPYLYGNRSIYGVMPDWNPAEMIGLHPKPLALSLYKYLITDGTWAYQRDNYGYQNLRSFPLMLDFCGLPYIDVRVSFNSFIPKSLESTIAEKLVNYYLDALARQPEKHDKVEFDIILSCYTFVLEKQLSKLKKYDFSAEECDQLKNELRNLTNHIINTKDGLWITDTEKTETLIHRHKQIMDSELDKISKIYWLLEDCNRYGTLPFAGLARAGFIAVQLLKSLVEVGVLSAEEYDCFMAEINTVSSQMAKDSIELSQEMFLEKYGHLRPGTYDITSMRYDHADYLVMKRGQNVEKKKEDFKLSLDQYQQIETLMMQNGLEGDVLSLFKFIKAAIEGREYAKFVFTKSVSDALELLAELGEELGFDREDMSYLDIRDVTDLYACADNWKERFRTSIEKGRRKYEAALTISLPPVILNEKDVFAFHLPDCVPNYITLGQAEGDICSDLKDDLKGKIVLLPAADPGYDWLFAKGIAGLITAFGGANSHMAIRAGELSIPAVIGVGEKKFLELKTSNRVGIDCGSKRIEVLQ